MQKKFRIVCKIEPKRKNTFCILIVKLIHRMRFGDYCSCDPASLHNESAALQRLPKIVRLENTLDTFKSVSASSVT